MSKGRGLRGQHVWVTRPADPADPLVASLRREGARVLHHPTVKIDLLRPNPFRSLSPERYGVWVFTSGHAVRSTAALLDDLGSAPGEIDARFFCVGSATAGAAEQAGFRRAQAPSAPGGARALAEWILSIGAEDESEHLFPCAEGARPDLPQLLREAGRRVDVVPIYRTTALAPPAALWRTSRCEPFDALLFTSPSAVTGFLDGKPDAFPPSGCVIAAIGATTADALERAGLPPDVIAPRPERELLVAALRTWFEEHTR